MTFLVEMRSRGMVMEDLLESLEVTAAKSLAPGLTLFRRYLDDAAQVALAGEIAQAVAQAPWFLPRMPRSGIAFSVKMTNCGCLGLVVCPTAREAIVIRRRIRLPGMPGLPSFVRPEHMAGLSSCASAGGLPDQFLRFFHADGPAPGPRRAGFGRASGRSL